MKKFALGINEAARATGTTAETIAKAIASRELPAVNLAGKPAVPPRALRRWVESRPPWYETTT